MPVFGGYLEISLGRECGSSARNLITFWTHRWWFHEAGSQETDQTRHCLGMITLIVTLWDIFSILYQRVKWQCPRACAGPHTGWRVMRLPPTHISCASALVVFSYWPVLLSSSYLTVTPSSFFLEKTLLLFSVPEVWRVRAQRPDCVKWFLPIIPANLTAAPWIFR